MPEVRSLLDQVFGQKGVEVDPTIKKFFLDTEELRAGLIQKQREITSAEQEIIHREAIAAKLAPGIELCHECRGSGRGHSTTRPGHMGPVAPLCGYCHGSGFRKKPVQKEL